MNGRADKLFVYGTLRRGFPLHAQLKKLNARYLGKGTISASLFNLGDYPGALPAASASRAVEGELYELRDPQAQLPVLDDLEEFSPAQPSKSLFVRRRATVRLERKRRVRAWVYFLPKRPSSARLIPSGDYAKSRRATR